MSILLTLDMDQWKVAGRDPHHATPQQSTVPTTASETETPRAAHCGTPRTGRRRTRTNWIGTHHQCADKQKMHSVAKWRNGVGIAKGGGKEPRSCGTVCKTVPRSRRPQGRAGLAKRDNEGKLFKHWRPPRWAERGRMDGRGSMTGNKEHGSASVSHISSSAIRQRL